MSAPMSDRTLASMASAGTWHRATRPLIQSFAAMRRAAATRHALAKLDNHALADIGLTRPEARVEAARAPWDITGRTPRTLWEVLREAWLRRRDRQMVATLDGATLRDLRFHHAELEMGANKPFWRL